MPPSSVITALSFTPSISGGDAGKVANAFSASYTEKKVIGDSCSHALRP